MLLRLAQLAIFVGVAFFICPALGGTNPMANNVAGIAAAWLATISVYGSIDFARALARSGPRLRPSELERSLYTPAHMEKLVSDSESSIAARSPSQDRE